MTDAEMRNMLSEVYATVMAMGKEWRIRLPDDVWQKICDCRNAKYSPIADENKALNEQGFSHHTTEFIAMLHRDYWCDTEEERESLIELFKENEQRHTEALSSETSLIRRLRKLKEQN